MPQPLSDLPALAREILKEADVDLDRYTGCRYVDRGGHFFVALYPDDDLPEDEVVADAKRVEDAGTHAGVGTKGWLLLPKVDKPQALDPDIRGVDMSRDD